MHPFVNKSQSFKYHYCFGLAVLVLGDQKATLELESHFQNLLTQIQLSESDQKKLHMDINHYFSYRIEQVLQMLHTKQEQYLFLVDLQKLYDATLWSQSYAKQVRLFYQNQFAMEEEEWELLQEFLVFAQKNEQQQAQSCYAKFRKAGYYLNQSIRNYINPSFQWKEVYGNLILKPGESRFLDGICSIEDLVIQEGATLVIEDAQIHISGSISCNGGRILIKNTQIYATQTTSNMLLQIARTAFVKIEHTQIDCGCRCGGIEQSQGVLLIENSSFFHTKKGRAIIFSGAQLYLRQVLCKDCQNGAVHILGDATATIQQCRFAQCMDEYGGGILSRSSAPVFIQNCNFHTCTARYFGAAIYFAVQKYAQSIISCEAEQCEPENNIFVNADQL